MVKKIGRSGLNLGDYNIQSIYENVLTTQNLVCFSFLRSKNIHIFLICFLIEQSESQGDTA